MKPRDTALPRNYAYFGFGCLALGLALSFLAFKVAPGELGASAWKGYRTLLVEESVPDSEVLSALTRAGITDVIADSTEPVLISDWVKLETISLSQALARLIPGDPRRDPYIEGLGSWFRAKANDKTFRIYYLKESPFGDPMRAGKRALAGFGGKSFFTDFEGGVDPSRRLGLSLAACALILSYCMYSSIRSSRRQAARAFRRMLLRLSLGLAWLPIAFSGLPGAAIAALWAIALMELAGSLDFPLEELRHYRDAGSALLSLRRGGRPSLSATIVAIGACFLAPGYFVAIATAIGASASLLLGFCLLSMHGIPRKQRLDFVPITIGRRASFRDYVSAGACVLALLFWAVLRFIPGGVAEQKIPDLELPLPIAGSGASSPTMTEARAQAETPVPMPGLAEWLVHRALQETIPLARLKEKRPDPFTPVQVAGKATSNASLSFDESWRTSVLRTIPAASMEGMLLSQGREVRGVFRAWIPIKTGPLAPIEGLLYIFLLVPPLRRIVAGASAVRSSTTSQIRQAA
jgi:hypothetical protein